MKIKRITIALISSLIVAVAFNTAIISAHLGNDKCQLFLSKIVSYTFDDWGGWTPEGFGNKVPGPSTHKEDVSTTYTVSDQVNYGSVVSASTSITNGLNGSFSAYGLSVCSNVSSTASLSGVTSSGTGTTILTCVTIPGEIYSVRCVSPELVEQCTPQDGFIEYCTLVASRRDALLQALK